MEPKEIDKDLRLRRFLSTNEGRTAYSFVRGSVFRHLGEILDYRMPVEKLPDDLAMQLLAISMIELAAQEFISEKEREVERLAEDKIRVV